MLATYQQVKAAVAITILTLMWHGVFWEFKVHFTCQKKRKRNKVSKMRPSSYEQYIITSFQLVECLKLAICKPIAVSLINITLKKEKKSI